VNGTVSAVTEAAVTAHQSAITITKSQISDLGTYLVSADIDTLAELNSIITDATLIDTGDSRLSDARTPTAHASSHANGADDIQDATAAQKGLATAAQISKLDGIEALADVTDTANVTGAGALMDSEITDLAGVKAVTISTLQPKPLEGAFVDGDKTKLDGIATGANLYVHPNHSGAITSASDGTTALGSFTLSALNIALSDATVATGGGTATGTNTGDQDLSGYQMIDAQLTSLAALSYTGNGAKVIAVNVGETGFELIALGGGGDALTSNPLSQFAATSSAQLAGVISDETGSGALVFGTSPTLTTPNLDTPSAIVLTNATGTAAGLTAGTVTTNANLTGHVTSTGNAAVLGSFTKSQLSTAVSDGTVLFDGAIETYLTPQTLTDGATVTYDTTSGVNANWTIGGDRTLSIPTNVAAGQSGRLKITQDGTGGRALTLASGWGLATGNLADVAAMTSGQVCVLSWTALTTTTFASTLIFIP